MVRFSIFSTLTIIKDIYVWEFVALFNFLQTFVRILELWDTKIFFNSYLIIVEVSFNLRRPNDALSNFNILYILHLLCKEFLK